MNALPQLKGLVTEADFADAEIEFPGIVRFYETCLRKPLTFLELLWSYQKRPDLSSLK